MESATIVGVKKYNSVVRESDLSFPNGEMVKRLDKEVGKVSLSHTRKYCAYVLRVVFGGGKYVKTRVLFVNTV